MEQNSVQTKIQKLCDRLEVVIPPVDLGRTRELIFSANFARDAFPIVDELVFSAPKIEGWLITAFMPRKTVGETYKFEGIEYPLNDVFFVPYTDGFDLVIEIYAELEIIPEDAIWMLLRDILGEYESVLGVKYVDIIDLAELDEHVQPQHISELNDVVENFHHFEVG